ncbi:MAG: molybdopterin-binding protein [Fusobacteriaceae bacterium]
MKLVNTVDAVGHILCHDITKIVPGEFKGVAFKKGHIVKEEDIEELLNIGKEHLYIYEVDDSKIHENDAAIILGDLGAGSNISLGSEIKEGKIDFYAAEDGILKVNKELLFKLNSLGEISFATLPNNYPVKKGQKLGGTRVIPLVIDKTKMDLAREVAIDKILEVKPFKKYKVGVVVTGGEVFQGRIEDKFSPVIKRKVEEYGSEVIHHYYSKDDKEMIKDCAKKLLDMGAEILIFTGGMSVDPDDLTPSSIMEMGGELVTYGSPVLPGAMFLLSYLNNLPMMGLPGCVMYAKRTIFDLVLPRVLTGEKLNMDEIARLGNGGLCQSCDDCHYPNCSFGK